MAGKNLISAPNIVAPNNNSFLSYFVRLYVCDATAIPPNAAHLLSSRTKFRFSVIICSCSLRISGEFVLWLRFLHFFFWSVCLWISIVYGWRTFIYIMPEILFEFSLCSVLFHAFFFSSFLSSLLLSNHRRPEKRAKYFRLVHILGHEHHEHTSGDGGAAHANCNQRTNNK